MKRIEELCGTKANKRNEISLDCLPRRVEWDEMNCFSLFGGLWPACRQCSAKKEKTKAIHWFQFNKENKTVNEGGSAVGRQSRTINGQAGMTNQAEARQAPTNSIQLFFLPLKREEKWMNLIGFFAHFHCLASSTNQSNILIWFDWFRAGKTNNHSLLSSIDSFMRIKERENGLSFFNQLILLLKEATQSLLSLINQINGWWSWNEVGQPEEKTHNQLPVNWKNEILSLKGRLFIPLHSTPFNQRKEK